MRGMSVSYSLFGGLGANGQYGTYKTQAGDGSCMACPSDTGTEQTGSTHLTDCMSPRANFRILASRQMIACPAGTSRADGVEDCTACTGNTISPSPGSSCQPCSATQTTTDHITCQTVASGGVQKRKKRSQQFLCPVGKRACHNITTNKMAKEAFVCLDTLNDAIACGGCPEGYEDTDGQERGQDCTRLDDMADARCVRGKCEITCPRGYKQTEGKRCVRLKTVPTWKRAQPSRR